MMDEAEHKLDRAFVARVAVYAGGLSAGLGIKALKRDLLAAELDDPVRRSALKARVMRRIEQALSDAKVTDGVDAQVLPEAAEAFLEAVEKGNGDMVTRKVAEGEPPEPGEDGRLTYPLNPDDLPMHKVLGVSPTSKRRWFRMVHKGEALIQVFPPEPGKAGRSVKGEPIDPKKPKDVSLASVMGANTAVEENRLLAECEGACEESATGRVRVVPEVVVEAVDAQTGSLPDAGVSQASILVKRYIKSGYGVSSSENVFLGAGRTGGAVEQKAWVVANNLVVNGTIFGAREDSEARGGETSAVDVQEVCAAGEIDGGSVAAGQILVVGDSRLARLDVDEAIRVDGDLVGGQVVCRQVLTVGGHMGSKEGGSRTRVIVPQAGSASRRQKRLELAVQRQKKALSEIQEKLSKLEDTAARRAKADPYWTALISGDIIKPRNPMEANALRQFRDMVNEKKAYQRSVKEVRLALGQLQEQTEEETQGAGELSVLVRVGGRLYLDASFEATVEVAEEAMASQITYMIEGKRFRNHTLNDIRSALSKQAKVYLEAELGHVGERRQAIGKMFEGAEHRPTGPQVKHRRFELPFTWSGQETGDEDIGNLNVSNTAFIDTSELRRLYVRAVAVGREVMEGVQVNISQEGPRVSFSLGTCAPSQVAWQADAEVLQALDGIVLQGVSAREFLII